MICGFNACTTKNNNNKNSHWNNQRQYQRILWTSRGYNKFLSKHRQSQRVKSNYISRHCAITLEKSLSIILLLICMLLTNLFAYIWLSCFNALCSHDQIQNFETSSQTKFCLSQWKIIEILTVCNRISWFFVIVLRPIDIKLFKQ